MIPVSPSYASRFIFLATLDAKAVVTATLDPVPRFYAPLDTTIKFDARML